MLRPIFCSFANLGAVQLNYGFGMAECRQAVDMVEADALILHLNPLQEAVQEGGDLRWAGLLDKISQKFVRQFNVPVIAKEVGWGISHNVAVKLIEAGVSAPSTWPERRRHILEPGGDAPSAYRATCDDWQRHLPTGAFPQPRACSLYRRRAANSPAPTCTCSPAAESARARTWPNASLMGADLVGLASPFLKKAVQSVDAVVEEMDLLATGTAHRHVQHWLAAIFKSLRQGKVF